MDGYKIWHLQQIRQFIKWSRMLWIDNNRGDDGVMVITMIMIIIIITIIADETDDDDDNDIYDTYHLVPTVECPVAYDYVDHLHRGFHKID